MLRKPEISAGLMSLLARKQRLFFFLPLLVKEARWPHGRTESGSSGPGLGPGYIMCCVLGQDSLLSWSGEMLGVTLRWTSIPSKGE